MWTVILTSSKCTSESSLHPRLACSVNINDHNLNVFFVILSTVGGRPNQVTHPMHMGPIISQMSGK